MDQNFMNFQPDEYNLVPHALSSAPKNIRLTNLANSMETSGTLRNIPPTAKKPGRYSKIRNKFREGWLLLPEFKNWLARVPGNPYASACTVCSTILKNYGKSELQKHGRGKRHLHNLSKIQDESLYVFVNPELELAEAMSSEPESSASANQTGEAHNNGSGNQASGKFIRVSDLYSILSGPLSFKYVQEISYFAGKYREDHITASQWFQRFERVANVAGWDSLTRLRILPLRLKGPMEEAFTRIENEYPHSLTYEVARQLLTEHWARTSSM